MFNALVLASPAIVLPIMIWWRPDGNEGPNRYRQVKAGNAQWITNPVKLTR